MNAFRLAKVWNAARAVTVLVAAMISYSVAQAQTPTCGLTSITEASPLIYPPIAKAARVGGTVILMVRFTPSGDVTHINVLSGPQMLRTVATNFVNNWHANEFTGPRECPIVVTFELIDPTYADTPLDPTQLITRIDIQHIIVRAKVVMLSDPEASIGHKRKHLLIF